MRKNQYVHCTIKHKGNDNECVVEFNGTDNEVVIMTSLILQNVADGLGIDIKKFCEFISKVTIESSKAMTKKDERKEENENH